MSTARADRRKRENNNALEDEIALLILLLARRVDHVRGRIGRHGCRRDVKCSLRLFGSIQREALACGKIEDILFDCFLSVVAIHFRRTSLSHTIDTGDGYTAVR